jgi:hypothetical protein
MGKGPFNVLDTVRINFRLCHYNNQEYNNEVATIVEINKDKSNSEWCILRFHNAGIGYHTNNGKNTFEIPIECLEKYSGVSKIQAMVDDYAIIDFDLDNCLFKSLQTNYKDEYKIIDFDFNLDLYRYNYNNALGKIAYLYLENSIEMCIFKFGDSELGNEHPTYASNTAKIPINCLNLIFLPKGSFKSMETSNASAKDTSVFDDFTGDETPTFKLGDLCKIEKCDYINKYPGYIGEIGTILSFYPDQGMMMCVIRFHN